MIARLVVIVAAVCAVAPPAAAQQLKVAVMPVDLDPTAKGKVPALINDLVLTAVHELRLFEVIGQSDINALLDFEQQRDLIDCEDDTTCIATIGGALGVDKIVALKIARLANDWVMTAKLINIKQTRVEERVSEFVVGDTRAMFRMIPTVIGRLFGVEVAPPPAPEPRAKQPLPDPEPMPGPDAKPPAPIAPTPPVPPVPAPRAVAPVSRPPIPEPQPSPQPPTENWRTQPEPEPEPPEERRGPKNPNEAYWHLGALVNAGFFGQTNLEGTDVASAPGQGLGPSFGTSVYFEWWFIRWVGIGILAEYSSMVLSGQTGRVNQFAGAMSVNGGFGFGSFLKLFVRFAMGFATADDPLISFISATTPHLVPDLYVGLWAGTRFHLTRKFSLTTSVGYVRTAVGIEFTDPADTSTVATVKQVTNELRLNAGLQIAF